MIGRAMGKRMVIARQQSLADAVMELDAPFGIALPSKVVLVQGQRQLRLQ